MQISTWLGSGWAVGLLLCSAPVMALEVSGITLPQTVHFTLHAPAPVDTGTTQSAARPPAETTLVLNGAGIRSKFIFDIYVGALYLPRPTRTAQAVLAMPGPKRVVMYMLYHEVSKQEMRSAWEEGFADNLSAARHQAMAAQLSAFEALFPTLRKGDVTTVDFMPDGSMRVSVNGTLRGTAPGSGLGAAVLSVWLGKYPADTDLKAGMLDVED